MSDRGRKIANISLTCVVLGCLGLLLVRSFSGMIDAKEKIDTCYANPSDGCLEFLAEQGIPNYVIESKISNTFTR